MRSPAWLLLASLAGGLGLAPACGARKGTGGSGGGGQGGGGAGSAGSLGSAGGHGTAGGPGTAGVGAAGVSGAAGSVGAGIAGATGGGAAGAGGTATAGTGGAGGGATGGAAGTGAADAGAGGRPDPGDAGPFHPLHMNDVTILAPLPASGATPVLLRGTDLADDGTPLVPRALFDRLARPPADFTSPILTAATHDRLHLVAVRFDLCDRGLPGVCPDAEDGRMRLVLQPIFNDGLSEDVGFHAFYAIRNDEIGGAVAALRDLARSAPAQEGVLRVSPALGAADPAPYATRLRAFVKRYGGESRLVRLTVNAQPQVFAQVRWELRGVEKRGGAFVDITIVGSTAISEAVILDGAPPSAGFDVKPVTDTPPGLARALSQRDFDAATDTQWRESLAALVAVEDPMSHTPETVACVGCHVSTVLMSVRAPRAGIDPLTLPGRYTSRFDLSTAGGKGAETRATRALGYLGRQPVISQRVVNETAQVLTEIETRYPGP
jgi:hypothetical protein